jgi:hypothetical protein
MNWHTVIMNDCVYMLALGMAMILAFGMGIVVGGVMILVL